MYRIAHQSLADHIRPPFAASHEQVFDPQARPVAAALLARYAELLASGVPVTGPGYLWRYPGGTPPTAGPAGLELICGIWQLANPRLLPDVAMAALEVAGRLRAAGDTGQEAVAPTEEAVQLYRDLARANPAFLPDLAGGAEQPRHPLQRGGPPPGRPGPRRGSRPALPGAGRGQPRLPPRPRRGAEQPRHPLQRGGPPPGRPGPHRGSRPALPRAGPRPTPPSSPTSPAR